jgi:hypothetical protein
VTLPVTEKGEMMNLSIEITEAEIKAAIERKIRVAIADESNSWSADKFIKAAVKKHWAESVDRVVQECLADTPRIQEKIKAAIEAKLKGQLTAMMKVKA